MDDFWNMSDVPKQNINNKFKYFMLENAITSAIFGTVWDVYYDKSDAVGDDLISFIHINIDNILKITEYIDKLINEQEKRQHEYKLLDYSGEGGLIRWFAEQCIIKKYGVSFNLYTDLYKTLETHDTDYLLKMIVF